MSNKLFILLKALSITLVFILHTMTAYGQSYQMYRTEQQLIIEQATWQIGPFRIDPSIQLRDIGYDNNVYLASEEDDPIADYTATISAGFNAHLLYKNWLILSISENPEYVYFKEEKNRRAFNNSFSPQVRLLIFNRFVVSGNYSYRKAKRRPSREFEVPVTERIEGYYWSIYYESERKTSFGFTWRSGEIRYDEMELPNWEVEISQALNHTTESRYIEFYYRLFGNNLFFISLGFLDYEFESFESQWRNSYSYEVLTGIQFPLLGVAEGMLAGGYRKLLPREENLESFSGFIGNTSLDVNAGRFKFRIRYKRDFQFSFSSSHSYFVENILSIGISYYLIQSVRLDYDYFRGSSVYPEVSEIREPEGRFTEPDRTDSLDIHNAGIFFRIFRNIGIGLRTNFWKRDSSFRGHNFKRWFVGIDFTYDF